MAVELSRVMGSAPQLITIGADKTLAIWDTISFKVLDCYCNVPRWYLVNYLAFGLYNDAFKFFASSRN